MKNTINVYRCPNGHETITRDADAGVTPYVIKCRTANCKYGAQSKVYMVDQNLTPQYEWYRRPNTNEMSMAELQHHENGGLFLRALVQCEIVMTGQEIPVEL